MTDLIIQGIAEILISHSDLLKIALRQKAKFEGWLKFELATYLEKKGLESVEVESYKSYTRDRADISFFHNENSYSIELKTSNTNWKISGVRPSIRPITKNIKSIITDAVKLNSSQGIVAFVLFPIPSADKRWEVYIDRIIKETGIEICKKTNCKIIEMQVDNNNKCDILICTFMSTKFKNW